MDERTIRFLLASMRYDDDIPRQPSRREDECLVIRGYLVPRELQNHAAPAHPAPATAPSA
jgi:hypothetical protein